MYFNETAVKLWGYRPDIGNPLLKYCACYKVFIDGKYIPPDRTPMAVTLETGASFRNVQAQVERPDGSTFHAMVSIDPVYGDDGKTIIGAINVFNDISDIKRNEADIRASEAHYRTLSQVLEIKVEERTRALGLTAEELRRSDDRYHKMVEEVEDYAIILLDIDGIILNWNKGAEKIKGYKEADIIGKSFREFYLPEDQHSGLPGRLLKEAKERGKALYEGWRKRKDGSVFWGSVVLTALHDDQGNVVGFSKVTRDLTEKKQSEDRMQEYMKELEFRNTELEQFVYAASHDMKEPLRKIHLYSSYISSNDANVLDEKSREYFQRSVKATERMRALIDDLLAYSKVSSLDEGLEAIDPDSIIDEITASYKGDFEQKKITIDRDHFPSITAVPFQIKQLLSNLIDNAVKYKHPDRDGYIHVGYELADSRNWPAAPKSFQQYHKITVTDNGLGFDPAYAGKIFEIFQRLPATGRVQGTGIGLAICKKIVQNHGGYIEASGKPGKGAAFSIYLPLF